MAQFYFKNDVQISSDGYVKDWQEGIDLIQEKLNISLEINGGEDGNFTVNLETGKPKEFIDET